MVQAVKHYAALLLTAAMLLLCVPGAALAADATATIDLSSATTDRTGAGWSWDYDTLTLTINENLDITINRTDNSRYYGIILPGGATLVNNGTLTVWFKGYESGGGGQGIAIYCSGGLTIKGGHAIFAEKDGGDVFAVSAATLTLDNSGIYSFGGGTGVIADEIEVAGNSAIGGNFNAIYNNSSVPISGSGRLVLIAETDEFDGVARNGFTVESDGLCVFTQIGLGPLTLANDATISENTALPEGAVIPSGVTLTIASPSNVSMTNVTNNGTINIRAGARLVNEDVLTNRGAIAVEGTLANQSVGTIDNTASGTLNISDGGQLSNSGGMTQSGQLSIASGGQLNNSGSGNIAQTGQLNIASGGAMDNAGTFTNRGRIANNGTINNTGTIQQNGSITGNAITGGGTVTQPASGGSAGRHYSLTFTAGPGGRISPSGRLSVGEGSRINFTVTPDSGNIISQVRINGVPVDMSGGNRYTIRNVQEDMTIEAVFVSPSNMTLPKTGGAAIPAQLIAWLLAAAAILAKRNR